MTVSFERWAPAFKWSILAPTVCVVAVGSYFSLGMLIKECDPLVDRLGTDSAMGFLLGWVFVGLILANMAIAAIVGPGICGAGTMLVYVWWKAITRQRTITTGFVAILFLVVSEPAIFVGGWTIGSLLHGKTAGFVDAVYVCVIAALPVFMWWRALMRRPSYQTKAVLIPLFAFLTEPIIVVTGFVASVVGYVILRGDAFIDLLIPIILGPALFGVAWPVIIMRWWTKELQEDGASEDEVAMKAHRTRATSTADKNSFAAS
ncbi:MAG TPA: hypothetical protein VFE62_18590 [Gemmataceae bacterium]|nr:hypothetical protein [Gemmataceae bacterium]